MLDLQSLTFSTGLRDHPCASKMEIYTRRWTFYISDSAELLCTERVSYECGLLSLWEPVYDIFVLGSIAMLPVWFCTWCLSGQCAVWKGCAGKTMHARKKLPTYKMFGWSSSFWWTKPKKCSTFLDGYFGWKLCAPRLYKPMCAPRLYKPPNNRCA